MAGPRSRTHVTETLRKVGAWAEMAIGMKPVCEWWAL